MAFQLLAHGRCEGREGDQLEFNEYCAGALQKSTSLASGEFLKLVDAQQTAVQTQKITPNNKSIFCTFSP
jgi:hypothetical protein